MEPDPSSTDIFTRMRVLCGGLGSEQHWVQQVWAGTAKMNGPKMLIEAKRNESCGRRAVESCIGDISTPHWREKLMSVYWPQTLLRGPSAGVRGMGTSQERCMSHPCSAVLDACSRLASYLAQHPLAWSMDAPVKQWLHCLSGLERLGLGQGA